jgi:hypothetical protein
MCAQCHAGYGWKDETFDFSDETNIDCLVCHETTGTYYKTPNSEGSPACSVMFEGKPPIDLAAVAQSVDLPSAPTAAPATSTAAAATTSSTATCPRR